MATPTDGPESPQSQSPQSEEYGLGLVTGLLAVAIAFIAHPTFRLGPLVSEGRLLQAAASRWRRSNPIPGAGRRRSAVLSPPSLR